MDRVYVGLGSNMGDPAQNIRTALSCVKDNRLIDLAAVAPFYLSEPIGFTGQPWFVNTVALLRTRLQPEPLLAALMDIEEKMGKERLFKWGPRIIDLDLLIYGQERIKTPRLELPHPRITERAFVVAPLADLDPDLVLPGGSRAADLARELRKAQRIKRL